MLSKGRVVTEETTDPDVTERTKSTVCSFGKKNEELSTQEYEVLSKQKTENRDKCT